MFCIFRINNRDTFRNNPKCVSIISFISFASFVRYYINCHSSSSLHKEIRVICVAHTLLFLDFITHLDHTNLYRTQSVLKMYSRLFLVQTVSRLVSPICTHWLLCLNQSSYQSPCAKSILIMPDLPMSVISASNVM